MSAATANLEQYQRAFDLASTHFAGSGELRARREHALREFLGGGFPTMREESWKYTDVRPIARRAFDRPRASEGQLGKPEIEAVAFTELGGYRLVFANGKYVPEHSAPVVEAGAGKTEGVLATGLGTILEEHPDWLDKQFAVDSREGQFAALNTAFLNDGAVIRVPDGRELDQPIYLIFLSIPEQTSVLAQPRILLEVGANARATVIEHYVSLGDSDNLTNVITEITCGPGSRLEHYRIQEESLKGFHIAGVHASQASDSRLVSHNIGLGGKLARCDLNVRLAGPGAEVALNGLYVVGNRQHLDNHTRIDHEQRHTCSVEDYRGVASGRGRAVFNGKVVVHANAQKTDAHQSNKNLLLSPDAEIDTKPELEIYADDVKCSHGATVGQLDKNSLFYLQSRGLDEVMARAMLTFAFAEDVITRIALQPIRNRLERAVLGRLPETETLRELV